MHHAEAYWRIETPLEIVDAGYRMHKKAMMIAALFEHESLMKLLVSSLVAQSSGEPTAISAPVGLFNIQSKSMAVISRQK